MLRRLCPLSRMIDKIESRECGIQIDVVFSGFIKPFALPIHEDAGRTQGPAPADRAVLPAIIPTSEAAGLPIVPSIGENAVTKLAHRLQILLFLSGFVEIEQRQHGPSHVACRGADLRLILKPSGPPRSE